MIYVHSVTGHIVFMFFLIAYYNLLYVKKGRWQVHCFDMMLREIWLLILINIDLNFGVSTSNIQVQFILSLFV
jgi:hypothetical protein